MKNIIISLLVLCFFKVIGQPINNFTKDIMLQTPTASGISKFLEIPTNNFTGVPTISIPVHAINEGSISLPISLSYHASGLLVSEISSWVGAGWSLNAGGSVTRTIVGEADEAGGYLDDASNIENLDFSNLPEFIPSNSSYAYYFNEIDRGALDTESDIWSFKVGSLSGRFIINKYGEPELIEKQNLKIKLVRGNGTPFSIIKSIQIIDANGNIYIFGALDPSLGSFPGNQNTVAYDYEEYVSSIGAFSSRRHQSAWHLIKITSQSKVEFIDLNYNDENYTIKSPTSGKRIYKKWLVQGTNTNCQGFENSELGQLLPYTSRKYSPIVVDAKRLSSINTSSNIGTVTFSANNSREDLNGNAKRLDQISVSINQSCINYNFNYGYFIDQSLTTAQYAEYKRLKLFSIQKFECNSTTVKEPPYLFSYLGESTQGQNSYFPNRFSYQTDHWGLFNGKTSNETNLTFNIPQTTYGGTGITFGNSDRNVSEQHAKIGTLNKITLPSGGYQEFGFESNKVEVENKVEKADLNSCASGQCCPLSSDGDFADVIFNTQEEINRARFDLQNVSEIYNQNCFGNPQSIIFFVYLLDGNQEVSVGSYGLNDVGGVQSVNDIYFNTVADFLPNQVYRIRLYSQGFGTFKLSTYSVSEEIAGGLRIKQMIHSDGQTQIIDNYNYTNPITGLTSGVLSQRPIYVWGKEFTWIGGNLLNTTQFTVFSNSPVFPISYYGGGIVGYKNVKVFKSGANGYTQYKYKVNLPVFTNVLPSPQTQIDPQNGHLIEMQSYDQNSSVIKSYLNNIDNNQTNINNIEGNFYKLYIYKDCQSQDQTPFYFLYPYHIRKGFMNVTEEINLQDNITTTTISEYSSSNSAYRVKLKTSITNSDDKTYKTEYRYPFNLPTTPLGTEMINRNILTPLEEITTVVENGTSTIISGSKTEYSFFNNLGVPTTSTTKWLFPHKFYNIETTWNGSNQPIYTIGQGSWVHKGTVDKIDTAVGRPSEFTLLGWNKEFYTWNITSKLLTSKQFGNFTWNYEYYPNSKLIKKITDIDGQFIEYRYDGLSRLDSIIERNGNRTTDFNYYYRINGGGGNQNFTEKITKFSFANANSQLSELKNRDFFDGLGRTIQSVNVGYSPTNKDVITAINYDNIGRPFKQYEPFESPNSNGTYYEVPSTAPHTLTTYEASPVNRPLSATPPSWYATTMTYASNTVADAVKYASNLSTNYPANSLSKETVTDPNGNKTITFKDKLGRLILTRKTDSNNGNTVDTYTDYDDKGRVRRVYPPGSTISTPNLFFSYLYDGEDKVTQKKIPGSNAVDITYNSRDLVESTSIPHLTQFLLTEYDLFGRPIKTGLGGGSNLGTMSEVISEKFYDGSASPYVVRTPTAIDKGKLTTTRTKVLGSTNYVLETNIFDNYGRLQTRRSNNHIISGNNVSISNSPDVCVNEYDFADNLTKEIKTHTALAGQPRTVTTTNVINSKGLLGSIKFNGGQGDTEKTISTLSYTFKNQVASRAIGPNSPLQTIDYNYNEQGWLTAINSPLLVPSLFSHSISTPTSFSGNSSIDIFQLSLRYDNPLQNVGATALQQKNGNISQLSYQVAGRELEHWTYSYDYLDRLTNSMHSKQGQNPSLLSIGQYSEAVTYDGPRGNITSIKRFGSSATPNGTGFTNLFGGLIDDLTMTYQTNTNRLDKVIDNAPTDLKMLGFNQVVTNPIENMYDASGNLTKDQSRNITVTYNHLNLPTSITMPGNKVITNTYDATGTKLTVTKTDNGLFISRQQYLDGVEYQENVSGTRTLEAIYHSEGRLFNNAGTVRHEFAIKDHLGNTRLTFTDKNGNLAVDMPHEILQENHFYPFGMILGGTFMNDGIAKDNAYQYNGKELESFGGLGWNDYGARFYDPSIGRFTSVDPLADEPEQVDKSPYAYGWNNPINYDDPDGKCPRCIKAAIKTTIKSIAKGKVDLGEFYDIAESVGTLVDGNLNMADAEAVFNLLSPVSTKELKGAKKLVEKALDKVDEALDGVKKNKTHGNKLDDKPAEGYSLRDRNTKETKKYGETTRGEDKYGTGNQKRYTKKYLKENNVDYVRETGGTKKNMHKWQHEKIKDHKSHNEGERPRLNKSDY